MKCMDKRMIKEMNKVILVMNERHILEEVAHPFVIKMHGAFQSVIQSRINQPFFMLSFCLFSETTCTWF